MNAAASAAPQNSKLKMVLFFLAAAIAVFTVAIFVARNESLPPTSGVRVGTATPTTGTAYIIRAGYTEREKLQTATALFHMDSIETGTGALVAIDLETTDKMQIEETSLVSFDKNSEQDKIVVHIRKGDITVVQLGRENEVSIEKNGKRVAVADFDTSDLKSQNQTTLTSLPGQATKSLTEEEITGILSQNRSAFFRCYTLLLQKTPTAKGEATLNFTIENSGRINLVEVSSQKLDFPDFKKCLGDAVGRINFRPFSGPVITSYFPLRFE